MNSFFRVGAGLLIALTLAGCKNKGENLPLEVAKFRVFEAEVPARVQIGPVPVAFPSEVFRIDAGLWQAGFREYRLPARAVQPVGSSGGLAFYALAWDSEPFDRLLVGVPGRAGEYREFLGVY
jgi:hypothetical protein